MNRDCSHKIKRRLLLARKAMTKLDSVLKSRDNTLLTNICIVKAMFFPVVMYTCESWAIMKAECQRIDGFELWCWRSKEIKPSILKGNQPWIFIGRTHAEAETPILWPPDARNWCTGTDPDAGKGWKWEQMGMTEDEMVGRHHWLRGCEFGWTLWDGEGQGGLACCSLWGCRELDTSWQLDNYGDNLYTRTY